MAALASLIPGGLSAQGEPAAVGESAVLSAGPLEYRPGRGARIGSTGLVVGGFTNVKGEWTDDSGGEFALDSLNFFLIFDRFSRFRAVAELQLKDVFVADDEGAGTRDFAFDARRLFGDFTVADELRARAGTFLTPVGYWNLILAPPLTWTTEPPLIVEEVFFQQTTTGVMLHGSVPAGGGRFGYSLFSQFLDPLEDDPDLVPPDETAGLRLEYEVGNDWSAGATYQASRTHDDWSHLGALHAWWRHERGEVIAELYVREGEELRTEDDEGSDDSQWGAYVQGVVEVYRPFYLVGRFEHFDPPFSANEVNAFTAGIVWKPFPFMAVKAEYRLGDHRFDDEDLDGFFASFATFF